MPPRFTWVWVAAWLAGGCGSRTGLVVGETGSGNASTSGSGSSSVGSSSHAGSTSTNASRRSSGSNSSPSSESSQSTGGSSTGSNASTSSSSASTSSSSAAHRMVLFGGNTSIVAGTPVHALGDTWTFDGSVWTPHPDATGPAARGYAAMARLGSGVVLNGGAGQGTFVLGDTWLWNGSTWSPESAGGPTARIGASAATLGGNVVLFGGASVAAPSDASLNAIYFNDTWLWNGTGWGSANVSGPPAREYASLAPLDGKLLLFGGQSSGQITESGLLGDTWTWDGSSWTQENALGPTPRCLSATAHVNGAVLLFGGEEDVDDTAILGDTWTWDGTAWTLQSVPGPAARYGASIASFGHGAVLYGGLGLNGLLSDTWIWDSGAWTEIPTQGPPARFGAAMSAE